MFLGAKPEDLKKTKFKSEMKKLFKRLVFQLYLCAVIKTDEDVDKAVKEISLPMISKPDNGVGAFWQPSNLKQKMISIISRLSGTMKQFISLKNL